MSSWSYQQISEHSVKVFHHEIQPAVRVQSTVQKVCPSSPRPRCMSDLFTAHIMLGLQSAGRNMCNFDGCCLTCMKSLDFSVASWVEASISLQRVWRSLVVLEPPKSQPHSQAVSPAKTCNKVSDSCGIGSEVFRPAQCTCLSTKVVDQSVNKKVQWSSSSTCCCFYQFIGHKMSACLWTFTCFPGQCGKLNARGKGKPTDANRTFL